MVKLSVVTLALMVSQANAWWWWSCGGYLEDCCNGNSCNDNLVCQDSTWEWNGWLLEFSECREDPENVSVCGMAPGEWECSPGDCMPGFACVNYWGSTICWEGEDPAGNNGLCEGGTELEMKQLEAVLAASDGETLCALVDEPCSVPGSNDNCCAGYVCTQGENEPVCAEDPNWGEECCLKNGARDCMPGDCCEGNFCYLMGGRSECRRGTEPSGRHDGLCWSDEFLLECVGNVAAIYGDPHLRSFDDFKWHCQGVGEFVIAKSNVKPFEVQGRFQKLDALPDLTTTRAVAISAEADTPIVQVQMPEVASGDSHYINSCAVDLYIDGDRQNFKNQGVFEENGVTITKGEWTVDIQYDTGAAVQISMTGSPWSVYGCILNTFVCLPSSEPTYYTNVTGLLGKPNGNADDDWVLPNGEKHEISISSNSDKGYEFCVPYYCLRDEAMSLFTYFGDQDFDHFMGCDLDPPAVIDPDTAPPEVKAVCNGDPGCLVDGIVGGVEAAQDTANTNEFVDVVKDGVIGFAPPPPVQSSCPSVELVTNDAIDYESLPIVVTSQDTDSVTFDFVTPFGSKTLENLFVKYVPVQHQSDKCFRYDDIQTDFSESITAYCMSEVAETMVYVYASDPSFDTDDKAPGCCHPKKDYPTVEYVFKVICSPECPEDAGAVAARRQLKEKWNEIQRRKLSEKEA